MLAVAFARECRQLPAMLKVTFQPWPGVPSPPLEQWVKFYRQHRRVRAIAECVVGWKHGDGEVPLSQYSEPLQMMLMGGMKDVNREKVLDDVRRQVATHRYGQGVLGPGASTMISDEAQFLWRVVIPYLIVYGDWPTRDYRLARQGDLAALWRLLRVDKAVIEDRWIRRLHAQAGLNRDAVAQRIISAALKSKPVEINVKKAKIFAASLISWIFTAGNLRITEPEVRRLFDLIAQQEGKLVDVDLPAAPESLAKAIQRGRESWPAQGEKSDKN